MKTVNKEKRIVGYYQIGMLFPDGNKIVKPKCDLNELFETYFIKLNSFLDKGYTAEQLYDLYQKTFNDKKIKIQINFIDSWTHKWSGKCAWPRKDKFIEYLNKRLNENHS